MHKEGNNGGRQGSKSYLAYGVGVASALPLAALRDVSGDEPVTVNFEEAPPPVDAVPQTDIGINLLGQSKHLAVYAGDVPRFEIDSVGVFHLRPAESKITFVPTAQSSAELICYWLLQVALPLYLHLTKRLVFLHGCAVRIGSGAVAFLADSNGGKSTLADFLVRQGHAFLTDDKLGLRREDCNRIIAVPSFPFIRPYRRTEDLGRPVERFAVEPAPLRAIYLLQLSDGPDHPVQVLRLPKGEAIWALTRHYRCGLFGGLAEQFSFGAELVRQTPVARLIIPRSRARLPEVHQAVLTDIGESQ